MHGHQAAYFDGAQGAKLNRIAVVVVAPVSLQIFQVCINLIGFNFWIVYMNLGPVLKQFVGHIDGG